MSTTYCRKGRSLPKTIKIFNEDRFKKEGVEKLINLLKSSKHLHSMISHVGSRLNLNQHEHIAWNFQPYFLPFLTVGKTTYFGVRGNVCGSILTVSFIIYRPSKETNKDPFLDGKVIFILPYTIFLSFVMGKWRISFDDDIPLSLSGLVALIKQARKNK